jgi:hypothetical protein
MQNRIKTAKNLEKFWKQQGPYTESSDLNRFLKKRKGVQLNDCERLKLLTIIVIKFF